LLVPICFPEHICGGIRKRSIFDNAERHHNAPLLVTLDVKQCFPSITNIHVYSIWKDFLGCEPPVASLLTRLTTFNRHLSQGSATSPLLANLFIWMIDGPIRKACQRLGVTYSTWIDDLAFSGEQARELIQVAVATLRTYGLRVSRTKVKIMGPSATKLITGTRLGAHGIRAPREKLSRIRSGIHKFESGLVSEDDAEKYLKGLVAQLRFVHQLSPRDAFRYALKLQKTVPERVLSVSDKDFLRAAGQ
jgi:retron-type reverse transcriptase